MGGRQGGLMIGNSLRGKSPSGSFVFRPLGMPKSLNAVNQRRGCNK